MVERTRGWVEQVEDRSLAIILVAVTVILSLPYAVNGPGFIIDDFFALREAAIDGWYMAAGSVQWSARPGAGVVYAIVFGLIGDRPLVVFAVQTALIATAAVLVFVLARTWMQRPLAFGAAFTWLLLPNHSALEVWASVINVLVALVLVLAAFVILTRCGPSTRSDAIAGCLIAVGVLSYEAVGPAGAAGVVAVGWFERAGRERLRLWLYGLVPQLAAGAWMLVNIHPEKEAAGVWLSPHFVVEGHFADGLFGRSEVGQISGLVLLLLVTAVVGRRLLRSAFADERSGPIFAGGLLLIGLGALPFVRYYYVPFGFGDRVTVVSGLGGALILVGTLLELRALFPNYVATAVVIAGLAVALPWRYELASTYSTAGADGRRLLEEVERRFPEPPSGTLVIGPYPVLENNVGPALQFDWPVQWFYRDRTVDVVTTYETAEFERYDDAFRIDLLDLTGLDPDVNPDGWDRDD